MFQIHLEIHPNNIIFKIQWTSFPLFKGVCFVLYMHWWFRIISLIVLACMELSSFLFPAACTIFHTNIFDLYRNLNFLFKNVYPLPFLSRASFTVLFNLSSFHGFSSFSLPPFPFISATFSTFSTNTILNFSLFSPRWLCDMFCLTHKIWQGCYFSSFLQFV